MNSVQTSLFAERLQREIADDACQWRLIAPSDSSEWLGDATSEKLVWLLQGGHFDAVSKLDVDAKDAASKSLLDFIKHFVEQTFAEDDKEENHE